MTKIAIVGCNGKMGGYVAEAVGERDDCQALFGVDAFGESKYDFPVYNSFPRHRRSPMSSSTFPIRQR